MPLSTLMCEVHGTLKGDLSRTSLAKHRPPPPPEPELIKEFTAGGEPKMEETVTT